MSPAQQIFNAGSTPGLPTTSNIIQLPTPQLGTQAVANPITGFKKLVAYGLAYIILVGIGSTKVYTLAYGIEGIAILALLLTPTGTEAFTALATFLKGTLKS